MGSQSRQDETESAGLSLAFVRAGVLSAVILSIPFALQRVLVVDHHSPDLAHPWLGAAVLTITDLLLAALFLVSVPVLARRSTYEHASIALFGSLGFLVATVVSSAFASGPEAVIRAIQAGGAVGAVVTVHEMSTRTFRQSIIWPLVATMLIQAPWAFAQTFIRHSGDTNGITARWDHVWTQGFGTMQGGYALASFMILSMAIVASYRRVEPLHPLMWVAIPLGSITAATAFGRLGVLAVLGIGSILLLGAILARSRHLLVLAIGSTVPMVFAIAITWEAWFVRAEEAASLNQSGREALLDQALHLIRANPLTGVGPGRYARVAVEVLGSDEVATVVHNVPVLITAEYGIPIGLAFAGWVFALGVGAVRAGVYASIVFVAIMPYFLFDLTHFAYAYGAAQFAVWLSVLDFHRRHPAPWTATPSVVEAQT